MLRWVMQLRIYNYNNSCYQPLSAVSHHHTAVYVRTIAAVIQRLFSYYQTHASWYGSCSRFGEISMDFFTTASRLCSTWLPVNKAAESLVLYSSYVPTTEWAGTNVWKCLVKWSERLRMQSCQNEAGRVAVDWLCRMLLAALVICHQQRTEIVAWAYSSTLHFAPCSKLVIIVLLFFTVGGQLRWALCLSGNPPLCVLLPSVFTAVFLYRGE